MLSVNLFHELSLFEYLNEIRVSAKMGSDEMVLDREKFADDPTKSPLSIFESGFFLSGLLLVQSVNAENAFRRTCARTPAR